MAKSRNRLQDLCDLFDPRNQYTLRQAWHLVFLRELGSRISWFLCFAYGLGFGVLNLMTRVPPVYAFVASFAFSALITFTSAIPWRLRLVSDPGRTTIRVVANTAASIIWCVVGFYITLFCCSIVVFGLNSALEFAPRLLRVAPLGLIGTITGLTIALGMISERKERRAAGEARRHARMAEEARLIALRAQINPHFFFNALNTIAALIPTRPTDAERAVELMAEALRPVLTRDQKATATVAEEVSLAKAYAEIEQLRFGDRLRFEADLQANALGVAIPSLSLQPLVENAIRHGLSPTVEKVVVTLAGEVDARGELRITVKNHPASGDDVDPARLHPCPFEPGHALHNINARARSLFGPAAGLNVAANGTCAVATLRIPANMEKP